MARATTALVFALSSLALAAGTAHGQAEDGTTGSGGPEAGESANTWGGVPVWVWALIIVAGFGLLLGLLFFATRGSSAAAEEQAPRFVRSPRTDTEPAQDLAIATFPHLNGAERAFAVARIGTDDAPWLYETTFVECHRHGTLVVRGTFAGHYVNAESADDTSAFGAVARTIAQTALDQLGVEVPPGSSALLVLGSAGAVDAMVAALEGHEVLRRHLSDEQAAALEAVADQAPPAARPVR